MGIDEVGAIADHPTSATGSAKCPHGDDIAAIGFSFKLPKGVEHVDGLRNTAVQPPPYEDPASSLELSSSHQRMCLLSYALLYTLLHLHPLRPVMVLDVVAPCSM